MSVGISAGIRDPDEREIYFSLALYFEYCRVAGESVGRNSVTKRLVRHLRQSLGGERFETTCVCYNGQPIVQCNVEMMLTVAFLYTCKWVMLSLTGLQQLVDLDLVT